MYEPASVVIAPVVVPPPEELITTEFDLDNQTLVDTLAKLSTTVSQNAKVSNNLQDEFGNIKQFVELNIGKLQRMVSNMDDMTRRFKEQLEGLTLDVRGLQALTLSKTAHDADKAQIWDSLKRCETFVDTCERGNNDAVSKSIREYVNHFVPRWYEPVGESLWQRVGKEIAAAKAAAAAASSQESIALEEKLQKRLQALREEVESTAAVLDAARKRSEEAMRSTVADESVALERLVRDVTKHAVDARQQLIDCTCVRLAALEGGQELLCGALGVKVVVSPATPGDADDAAFARASKVHATVRAQIDDMLAEHAAAKQLARVPRVQTRLRVAAEAQVESEHTVHLLSGIDTPSSRHSEVGADEVLSVSSPTVDQNYINNNNTSTTATIGSLRRKSGSKATSRKASEAAPDVTRMLSMSAVNPQHQQQVAVVDTSRVSPSIRDDVEVDVAHVELLSRMLLETGPLLALRRHLHAAKLSEASRTNARIADRFARFMEELQPVLDDKVGISTLKELLVKNRDEKLYRNVDKLLADVAQLAEDKVSTATFAKQMADKAERGALDLKVDKVYLDMFASGVEQRVVTSNSEVAVLQNAVSDVESKISRIAVQVADLSNEVKNGNAGGGVGGTGSARPGSPAGAASTAGSAGWGGVASFRAGAGRAHFTAAAATSGSSGSLGTPRGARPASSGNLTAVPQLDGHVHAVFTAAPSSDQQASLTKPSGPTMSDVLFSMSEKQFSELKAKEKREGKPIIEPRPPKDV